MNFLTEAFQKLNLVESEEFSLDKKGTEKLKTFLDDDAELDVVTVIDPSEDNQADIENVHLGMTILGCEICNQLHYCDPEEVVIDEESQMANVGVCCPYCFGTDGFKIVGTVAPFEDITVEVVNGDKDGIDVKVDGEEVEGEDKKEVNESLGSWVAAKKYQKMKGKEHDVMSKTAGEGASEEEVAKVEKEKKDFQDKMARNKMAAKAGAREGNKTQQVLDKTATDARNAGAERGRQTIAKNRKTANRTELAKKYFGTQSVDDKQIDRMTKELAAAGYSLQEDLGSWIAAKKLAKMKKNGPKDGEDLEARKDKMDRLKMRAKAGAQDGNKTQKVLDDANAEERRRNGQKGAQARHNQAVDKKKQALVTKFGVKDTAALDALLKKSGYVAESLCEAPYLDTQYDSRKSFYNKARINDENDTLYSYETKVMEIKDGKPVLTIGADLLSQTTLRHIKEFLKQKGFPAESKQQILRDYAPKMEEALNESPMVDLTDDEYADLMKKREANKPTDNTTSNGTRGVNLLKSLKDKGDSRVQSLLKSQKERQDKHDSLVNQIKGLSGRIKEMIQVYDECSRTNVKVGYSNNTNIGYMNKDDVTLELKSNSGLYGITSLKKHSIDSDTLELYIYNGGLRDTLIEVDANGKIIYLDSWLKSYIDRVDRYLQTFIECFDKLEDKFYDQVEQNSSNSSIKESLKNRLNRKSLKEAKKVKSTDDLTDDDIFGLVYDKLTEGGPQLTKDADGKKTTPRLSLGVGYEVGQVNPGKNKSGIDCIVVKSDNKEDLQKGIDVATYYDCLYEVSKLGNDKYAYGLFIDYGSGDLEKLLADEGKPFAGKKKGEKLQNSQKYPIESPLPAQTGLRKNGKLDLSKTKAGDPNKSEILVEDDRCESFDNQVGTKAWTDKAIECYQQAANKLGISDLDMKEKNGEALITFKKDGKTLSGSIGWNDSQVKSVDDAIEVIQFAVPGLQESLREGMEDISITTDDTVIKVKATPRADKETIVPPVEEEEPIEELPEEEVVEEEDMPIEDAEVDIEDVDEEGFDELGESYLKRVYENVKSFKTVSGQTGKNKIILEGIITFKSGKRAKTSFILEAKEMTKRGKVRFTGMNENISKNKSAYTVTGRVENKKLMVESFNYNYLGKDSTTGKSKKLYGTVRRSK